MNYHFPKLSGETNEYLHKIAIKRAYYWATRSQLLSIPYSTYKFYRPGKKLQNADTIKKLFFKPN